MINVPITVELIRGAAEIEATERGLRPHRLPAWARRQCPDPQLMMVESQPSGVRLAFTTAARNVEVVTHPYRVGFRGAVRPRGCVDLVVDDELIAGDRLSGGDLAETDLQSGSTVFHEGPSHTSVFSGLRDGEKNVEIWLPHNESVELVELRTDAPVAPTQTGRPVWLHHGSSISQGSNATSPTRIWPAVAARSAGVELMNLGLGGSALVDQFAARVMRDTPADFISVKLGINVVNFDGMRPRTFESAVHGFLDTIRDGHEATPLMLISPIFCGIHEDTPGPCAVDPSTFATGQVAYTATGEQDDVGRLTLRIIRDAMKAVAGSRADDPNLHYFDGLELYGEADAAEHPLPDALHPDTDTHHMIGRRFVERAFREGGPFGRPTV
ncbi:GDSL-type esterase/lipase family protein [Spelaeicoccus albus]|uniref:SGNH hydrolase-type esterase domain-containing protein n=1 Tax=Spelaeicoccus albus TaxID=1280376 RepID=A0A7Z0D515_9MICO|nr:SGNH/GDSL hydrolase family protein [Spelaeicoccus albus]NYI69027.1 hypothetical protein [Spelaeicoccus albus]